MTEDRSRRKVSPSFDGRDRSVSVVVPVFNAENWIEQAVRSVTAEPEVMEILLVEDGSTDRTLDVCKDLEKHIPTVSVLRHPGAGNRGAAASRNLGIERAQGKFISFLDADDIALPERFAGPVSLLLEHPEIDGVYEAVAMIESEISTIDLGDVTALPLLTLTEAVGPERFLEALLVPGGGTVHTDGFVVRRSVFDRIGGFRTEFEPAEDMHLFWRMAAACTMWTGRLNEAVAVYRRHSDSLSVASDPAYLEDPFLRALDVCVWARKRKDVSPRNKGLLKRVLVHNIAAWWGGPISRTKLRRTQVRRLLRAARHVPEVLLAPKIWLGALGIVKDPPVTRAPDWKRPS